MTFKVKQTRLQPDVGRTARSLDSLVRVLATAVLMTVWGFPICAMADAASDAAEEEAAETFYQHDNEVTIKVYMNKDFWETLLWEKPMGPDGTKGKPCKHAFTGDRYEDYLVEKVVIQSENSTPVEKTIVASPKQDLLKEPNIRITKKSYCGSYNRKGLDDDETPRAPSLKLKFDNGNGVDASKDLKKVIGTPNIMLNNSQQDPALVRQCVGYEYAAKAGLPAQRCNFAKVYIYDTDGNELYKYTYINLEPFKKLFARRNFDVDENGNLYEFEHNEDLVSWQWIRYDSEDYGYYINDEGDEKKRNWVEDDFEYVKALDPDIEDDDLMPALIGYKGWSHEDKDLYTKDDLRLAIDIIEKIRTNEDGYTIDDLDLVLDIDSFIKLWAMEILLVHFDGYSKSQNNTVVYNDIDMRGISKDDLNDSLLNFKFVMSGIDLILVGDNDANDDGIEGDWIPRRWNTTKYHKGIVADLLWDDQDYRGQLWDQMYEYLDTLFSPLNYSNEIEPLIDQLTAIANKMREKTGEGPIDPVETYRLKTMFTAMRAGMDKEHAKRIGLTIVYPTEAEPVTAGAWDDPGKMWVMVQAKTGEEFDKYDFEITIGGQTLDNDNDIIDSYMMQNQFWMVVKAPAVLASPGKVDLVVKYTDDDDDDTTQTAENAVIYRETGNPVDTVIAGDVSLSMTQCGKLEAAKAAARLYVNHANAHDKIGVAHFSEYATSDLELHDATDAHKTAAITAINEEWNAAWGTNIADGIVTAAGDFEYSADPEHDWKIALLSDGKQSVFLSPTWEEISGNFLDGNSAAEIGIDTVALGADADVALMTDIANLTSGTTRFVGLEFCPDEGDLTSSTSKSFSINALETNNISNALADVYKSFAENARMENRIGDWSGALNFDWWSNDYYLPLESGLPEVTIAVSWDPAGSPLTMYINDMPVESLTEGETVVDTTHVQYRLQNPAPGNYKITVLYEPNPTGNFNDTPYRLMASAKSLTSALLIPDSVKSSLGSSMNEESIPIRIFVGGDTGAITDAVVEAEITSPSGDVFELILEDNGISSDATPGDGLYGAEFDPQEEGTHTVVITVTGIDEEGNEFTRRETDNIEVTPTVELESSSICVLGESSVDMRDRSVVTTDVAAGTYLEIGAPATLNGNGFVGGNAFIRSYGETVGWGVVNGDLTLSGQLGTQGNYTIAGTLTENGSPTIPTLPTKTFATGTEFQYLEGVQTLAPGTYGDVELAGYAEVTLSSGVYNVASLSAWYDAILNISGDVEINVQGDLFIGDRTVINGGEALTVYSNASEVRIGTDVIFNGVIIAPNANVSVNPRTVFTGCLGAENIVLDVDVSLVQNNYSLFAANSTTLKGASCLDGVRNGTETGVDCGGDWCDDCGECTGPGCEEMGEACNEGDDCISNYCNANSFCSAAPAVPVCSESTATDLGAPGATTTIQNDGCAMARDEYPDWWGTRVLVLQTSGDAEYPLYFTWSNACTGNGGTGMLSSSWGTENLSQTSSLCATVIDFEGSGNVSIDVTYYGG